MTEKFSLLSQDEPTDEQLHMITRDALAEVIKQSAIGDANLKKMMEFTPEENALRKVIAARNGK